MQGVHPHLLLFLRLKCHEQLRGTVSEEEGVGSPDDQARGRLHRHVLAAVVEQVGGRRGGREDSSVSKVGEKKSCSYIPQYMGNVGSF